MGFRMKCVDCASMAAMIAFHAAQTWHGNLFLSVARQRANTPRMDKPVEIPTPPKAEQRPYSYERHGVTIADPWHWLRDPEYPQVSDPDILAYLNAENAYFGGWAERHRALIDQLFEELKGRIKEDDSSVPIRDGDYLYWWAFAPGAQYRSWCSKFA
jgi:oligopeptidase B